MIDITNQLTDAYAQAGDWSVERGLAALERVSEHRPGKVDWDSGAGEDWAAFLVDDRLVTIAHLSVPIAVTSDPGQVEVLRNAGVREVVVVPDFADAALRCEVAVLDQTLFAGSGGVDDSLDPEAFSARDLWAATV